MFYSLARTRSLLPREEWCTVYCAGPVALSNTATKRWQPVGCFNPLASKYFGPYSLTCNVIINGSFQPTETIVTFWLGRNMFGTLYCIFPEKEVTVGLLRGKWWLGILQHRHTSKQGPHKWSAVGGGGGG